MMLRHNEKFNVENGGIMKIHHVMGDFLTDSISSLPENVLIVAFPDKEISGSCCFCLYCKWLYRRWTGWIRYRLEIHVPFDATLASSFILCFVMQSYGQRRKSTISKLLLKPVEIESPKNRQQTLSDDHFRTNQGTSCVQPNKVVVIGCIYLLYTFH
jgi:hypothetical protein